MPRACLALVFLSSLSSFNSFSARWVLVLRQLWGMSNTCTLSTAWGIQAAWTACLSAGLGADCEHSQFSLVLWLDPWGHVRDGDWNSELWLLALLFLFKNRLVCWAFLGWKQLQTATGRLRWQYKICRDVQSGAQDPSFRLLLFKFHDTWGPGDVLAIWSDYETLSLQDEPDSSTPSASD